MILILCYLDYPLQTRLVPNFFLLSSWSWLWLVSRPYIWSPVSDPGLAPDLSSASCFTTYPCVTPACIQILSLILIAYLCMTPAGLLDNGPSFIWCTVSTLLHPRPALMGPALGHIIMDIQTVSYGFTWSIFETPIYWLETTSTDQLHGQLPTTQIPGTSATPVSILKGVQTSSTREVLFSLWLPTRYVTPFL